MNRFVTTCDVCGCDCYGNYYLIQKYPININYFTGTESNKRDICEFCYKRVEVTFKEISKAYGRKYK